SVSLTVTVKEQFVTPAAFAAVQSTRVVPTRNVCGELMFVSFVTQTHTCGGVPCAGTLKATKREHPPGVLFVAMFAGHWRLGGVLTTVQVFDAPQLNETPLPVLVACMLSCTGVE